MFTDDAPVYQQLADRISDGILAGTYAEGTAVPSMNELAVFYTINPITASKGVNVLVEQGVLYKKRGVGMFVAPGARELLRSRRRAEFREKYAVPFAREARLLGFTADELTHLIKEEVRSWPTPSSSVP